MGMYGCRQLFISLVFVGYWNGFEVYRLTAMEWLLYQVLILYQLVRDQVTLTDHCHFTLLTLTGIFVTLFEPKLKARSADCNQSKEISKYIIILFCERLRQEIDLFGYQLPSRPRDSSNAYSIGLTQSWTQLRAKSLAYPT